MDMPESENRNSAEIWHELVGEPFDDLVGPFQHRQLADGSVVCRFQSSGKNTNGLGILHGGALMTFADYSLFVTGKAATSREMVTVSVTADFTGSASAEDEIEARCEVVKKGRSLVFMRGMLSSSSGPIMSFSGIMKTVRTDP